MEKLYVVVRSDLSPGQQAIQAGHALAEFLFIYPDLAKNWHDRSNYLAYLAVPDEAALSTLLAQASFFQFRSVAFFEPDLGGSMTALAIEPAGWAIVRRLPLILEK